MKKYLNLICITSLSLVINLSAQKPCLEPSVLVPFGNRQLKIIETDFNKDGNMDIIASQYETSFKAGIKIMLGTGNGTFTYGDYKTYSNVSNPFPYAIVSGDFNGDNHLDIVAANFGYKDLVFFPGNGNGTIGTAVFDTLGFKYSSMSAGDFNGDGKLDLVVSPSENNPSIIPNSCIAILLGNGDGSFKLPQYYKNKLDIYWPGELDVRDFNNDGYLDIVSANFTSLYGMSFFKGNNTGRFDSVNNYQVYGNGILNATDLNKDGYIDISIGGLNAINIMYGKANGKFSNPKSNPISNSYFYTSIKSGDFNNDSKLDIVVIGNDNFKNELIFNILTQNHIDSFIISYSENTPKSTSALLANDWNKDGRTDIIHNYKNDDSLAIRLNCIAQNTGNNYLLKESEILVYPNPVKDILTIEFSNLNEVNHFEVVNKLGQILISKNLIDKNNVSINVSELPNDFYTLVLYGNGDKIKTHRFIKIN